VLWVPALSRR